MLAMADCRGIVEGSIPGLADLARVTIDECKSALLCFMSPDEYSRTKDHEGRRIEEIDGGWRILNHKNFRDKARDRAAYMREYRKNKEQKVTKGHERLQNVTNVTNVTAGNHMLPPVTESNANSNANSNPNGEEASGREAPASTPSGGRYDNYIARLRNVHPNFRNKPVIKWENQLKLAYGRIDVIERAVTEFEAKISNLIDLPNDPFAYFGGFIRSAIIKTITGRDLFDFCKQNGIEYADLAPKGTYSR
jgi:hypothetical protein